MVIFFTCTAIVKYTHKDRVVILTVMDPKQAVLLERHIQAVDPEAFLMVTKSSEIMFAQLHALNRLIDHQRLRHQSADRKKTCPRVKGKT